MRTPAALAMGLLALPGTLAAQSPIVSTLTRPDARFAEPFSHVSGVRELGNGQVIVVDSRDPDVVLVDLGRQSLTALGRKGAGPREYQWPGKIFALSGGRSAIIDRATGSILTLAPDGSPLESVNWRPVDVSELASTFLGPPEALDGEGRMYAVAQPVAMVSGGLRLVDSAAIQRWGTLGDKRDTVGFLGIDPDPTRRVTPAGVSWRPNYQAFGTSTQWAVADDGGVAIVEADPYRVVLIAPSGERRSSGILPYLSIRVSEEHKRQFLAQQNSPGLVWTYEGGVARASIGPPLPAERNWSFPEFLPAFLRDAVSFDQSGILWIRRTTPADAPPTFDLIDREAKLLGRVVLPRGSRVVGFGQRHVYLTVRDDDDLEYLERYRFSAPIERR